MARLIPCLANAIAIARPIPFVDAVMIAFFIIRFAGPALGFIAKQI